MTMNPFIKITRISGRYAPKFELLLKGFGRFAPEHWALQLRKKCRSKIMPVKKNAGQKKLFDKKFGQTDFWSTKIMVKN